MREQLSFDLDLLSSKKHFMYVLLAMNLIFLFAGSWFLSSYNFMSITLTVMFTMFNTYVIMGILNCHTTESNLTGANYALCMYFPTKRSYFYGSKSIITAIILCYQVVVTTLVMFLSCLIHGIQFQINDLIVHYVLISFVVSISCSLILLTCFSGMAFQIGTILGFTVIGMVMGGFGAAYSEGGVNLSIPVALIIILILFVVWIIANIGAMWITKKVTV